VEDRSPNSLLLVFTNCKGPAEEEALAQWYNLEYVPAVAATGLFASASRWLNTDYPAIAEHKGLTIFEDGADPVVTHTKLLKRSSFKWLDHGGRKHPSLTDAKPMLFTKIATVNRPGTSMAGKKSQGFMLVFSDCTDRAGEAEFNKWYTEEHLPGVISRWGFYTASRWLNVKPQPGDRKYLALYEYENDPTEMFKAMHERLSGLSKGVRTVKTPSGLANTIHWLFRRVG